MGRSIDESFNDDHDDTRSFRSLDFEEAKAMLQDAPQNAFLEPSNRRRLKDFLYPCSITTNLLLFAFLLVILGNPCYFSSRTCLYQKADSGNTDLKLMGEEHGMVPDFGLEKVVFTNDSRYANEEMFNDPNEYDKILKKWDEDMPIGRGFIQLSDEDAKLIPRPFRLRGHHERNGYSIASLHQFHCLYMIMKAMGDSQFKRPSHNSDMKRHVTHCFDYLRQSAQCAGDSALEGMSMTVNKMTDGWGYTHICKKDSELVQWVADNRLSNNVGIH